MRPLPFNIEAEQAVLGSLLIDPEAFKRTRATLAPGDFYRETHREVFIAMCRLYDRDALIEPVALYDAGIDAGLLSKLTTSTPTAIHLQHYAQIVKDHAERRALIDMAERISRMAYDDSQSLPDAKKQARHLVRELTSRGEGSRIEHISVALDEAIDDAERLMLRGESPAIPCALSGVRGFLRGYHPSEQTVLGARPSVGKTSLAAEEAINAAVKHGKVVLIFSLEMSRKSIGKRVGARVAQLGLGKLRNGPITQDDYARLVEARESLIEHHLYLDPTPGLSAPEIHARAEALAQKVGQVDLVIVDFLGIMGSPFGRNEGARGDSQKRLEVGHNALLLRELARDLECHMLLLAQINRGATSRAAARPTMADLKESGSIEEIADNIILLHNASKYDDNAPKDVIELVIAKGRNDSTGSAFAHLDGPTGTWTDHNEAPAWLAAQEPPAPHYSDGW